MNLRTRCAPRRHGLTLMEMMTVLTLLTVVAALSWPSLRGSLANGRLRDAARNLRSELAKTRLKAMKTGTPQQFRYHPGDGRFEIAPQADDSLAAAESDPRSHAGRSDEELEAAVSAQYELPDGVSFASDFDAGIPRETAPPLETDAEGWAPPIVFLPNGRTSDARIRLHGERHQSIEVILRGLTGVATAGELRHDEERR